MTDTQEIPAHLGGNIPGGDPATWYPELWTWLVRDEGVKSVLDVGCGDGVSTNFFADLGAHARGIDGVEHPENPLVEAHDFTEGSYETLFLYDLVWCCEFVEHVEEQYRDNFGKAFQAGKIVLMTHAEPGQGGHHHVNCRTSEYWANWMGRLGFDLDEALTRKTRILASLNEDPWNHYKRSGMAFRQAT